MTTAMLPRLLTSAQVSRMFGVCTHTLRSWVRQGKFPAPLACSPRKLLWPEDVVLRALEQRRPV